MDLMWINVEKSWRLNEKHYGNLQGLNKAETAAKYGDEQVLVWRRSYDVPPAELAADDPRNPRLWFHRDNLMGNRRPIDGGRSSRELHGFRPPPEKHLAALHEIQLDLVMLIRRVHGLLESSSAVETEGHGVDFRRSSSPSHKKVSIREEIPAQTGRFREQRMRL